jgi:hypothetical protein
VYIRIPVVSLYTWKFTKFLARLNIASEKDSIVHNSDCCVFLQYGGRSWWKSSNTWEQP